jgi:hypothetical protein
VTVPIVAGQPGQSGAVFIEGDAAHMESVPLGADVPLVTPH